MIIEIIKDAPHTAKAILSVDFFTDNDIGGEYVNEIAFVAGMQFGFSNPIEDRFNFANKFIAKDNLTDYLQSLYPTARIQIKQY